MNRLRVGAALLRAANGTIITNAGSMIAAMAMTSGLGAAYWLLAARFFNSASVGFAGAGISAMTLLANVGMLGMGTLLIGELPRQAGEERKLIASALTVVGVASGLIGLLFALSAPLLSANLGALGESALSIAVFALGAALTAVTTLLDQALIGLLRGSLQFARNAVFAVTKLAALLGAGLWLSGGHWATSEQWLVIYGTWLIGNVVSTLLLTLFVMITGGYVPLWRVIAPRYLLRRFGVSALIHHWLNLAIQAPGFALPIVVTVALSSTQNACFYIASLIANIAFYGPLALVTALYAVGARNPDALAQRMRFTLSVAFVGGLSVNILLFLGADDVLRLFGADYAAKADWILRFLGLLVFPVIIKDHFVTIGRIHGRIAGTAMLATLGSALEVSLAAIGAMRSGTVLGLVLGWLAALCIEAILMAPWVIRTAVSRGQPVVCSAATVPPG